MKAFVGISGGVDSSVSAALLKEAGHDVVGVFLRVWQPDFLTCTWRDDRTDAKRVCATLNIPFVELDCADEYKREVGNYMIEEYRNGRTPNPDIMCNAKIKFGIFYEKAKAMGADIVATGHYAQVHAQNHTYQLLKGVDEAKDQSYFLWKIKKAQLPSIQFPIGHLRKVQVRAEAARFGLHTATKKDSQGVCFLGKLDMHDFLAHFIEQKQGDVLDLNGNVIGHHDGAVFLTPGQRHGFAITKKTPHDAPYYIVKKNIEDNTVTVSATPVRDIDGVKSQTIRLSQTNWLTELKEGKAYDARLRYRQKLFRVRIDHIHHDETTVTLLEPQAFVPAGQSLVLYDENICLGGGVIEER